MVEQEQINSLISTKLARILLVAEAAIPAGQFQAYRKFVLDEFGKSGLIKELEKLFSTTKERHGTGRNILRKGRGAS